MVNIAAEEHITYIFRVNLEAIHSSEKLANAILHGVAT
jgi:hypothetical protein